MKTTLETICNGSKTTPGQFQWQPFLWWNMGGENGKKMIIQTISSITRKRYQHVLLKSHSQTIFQSCRDIAFKIFETSIQHEINDIPPVISYWQSAEQAQESLSFFFFLIRGGPSFGLHKTATHFESHCDLCCLRRLSSSCSIFRLIHFFYYYSYVDVLSFSGETSGNKSCMTTSYIIRGDWRVTSSRPP